MGDDSVELVPLVRADCGIFCHMLRIGGRKIVVDCGLDSTLDHSAYDGLVDTIEQADCLIITSFDLAHCGAVSLFKKVPKYCSTPTAVLGQILLDDLGHKMKLFKGREMELVFDATQIKFIQPFRIGDVEICAYNGGFCLGNSMFRISHKTQSVLVGYNMNHRREHHLSGLDRDIGGPVSTIITDASSALVPPYSLASRDDTLRDALRGCEGRVIISIGFVRLAELLCMLVGEDVIVISRWARTFVERIKSMIEWAGPFAGESFSKFKFAWGKISEIGGHRVVVVVNEGGNDGLLGSVLNTHCGPLDTLLLVDQQAGRLNYDAMRAYEFSYTVEKVKKNQEDPSKRDDEADEDGMVSAQHWTRKGNVVFLDGYAREHMFPYQPRRVYNSDYGEAVRYEFEEKTGDDLIGIREADEVEVEHAVLVREGVPHPPRVLSVSMCGRCDLRSSRVVLEEFHPAQVVVVPNGTGAEEALFYRAALVLSPRLGDVKVCDGPCQLHTAERAENVALAEDVQGLRYKQIGRAKVAKCIVRNETGTLHADGDYPPLSLGVVALSSYRRALIEAGFRVASEEDALRVNESLSISVGDGRLYVETDEPELLVAVRNVLYNFVGIV